MFHSPPAVSAQEGKYAVQNVSMQQQLPLSPALTPTRMPQTTCQQLKAFPGSHLQTQEAFFF